MRTFLNNEVLANSGEICDKSCCLMQSTKRHTNLGFLPPKGIAQCGGSTADVRLDSGLRERQLTYFISHNICSECPRGYSKTQQENNKYTVMWFTTLVAVLKSSLRYGLI